MVFSSIIFLFRFLPVSMALYFLTPRAYKNLMLLIISLLFYSWGDGRYIFLMILSILVDYCISITMEKYSDKKRIRDFLITGSIIFNMGLLFVFKYFNFFMDNINYFMGTNIKALKLVMPLGISFYTFQTMSYSLDVYKGNIKAERNIIDFGAYICLFPQLIAGPIVKYVDISRDLKERKVSIEKINSGIRTFIIGLGKKVLIANNIGMLWTEINGTGINSMSSPLLYLGIIAFSLQIYFDFSGYSSMAIGLGRILGFEFPQNFNYPYISRSISEFWRRWHITLGSWFKEYVYIPLGGNRKGKARTFFNLLIVWFLTGLWHGASYNFILWGLYFFLLISMEKAGMDNILKKYKVMSHGYTLFALILGWLIFAVEDIKYMYLYLQRFFVFKPGMDWIYYGRNYGITMIIAILCSTPVIKKYYRRFVSSAIADAAIMMIIFILSVSYLVDATYNPFLYFRF